MTDKIKTSVAMPIKYACDGCGEIFSAIVSKRENMQITAYEMAQEVGWIFPSDWSVWCSEDCRVNNIKIQRKTRR